MPTTATLVAVGSLARVVIVRMRAPVLSMQHH
jgi:hypothetical protein